MNLKKIIKAFLISSTMALTVAAGIGTNFFLNYEQILADTAISEETTLASAFNSGGNYYLTGDYTFNHPKSGNIVANHTVNIDLKGFIITLEGQNTFTLESYQNEKIQFSNGTINVNYLTIDTNHANLTFHNVTLVNCNLKVTLASTCNLNNCQVKQIKDPGSSKSYGILVDSASTLNINNTEIHATDQYTAGNGTAIQMIKNNAGSSPILNITNNSSIVNFNTAINITSDSSIKIVDSEITNNYTGLYFFNNNACVNFGGNTKLHNNSEDMTNWHDSCTLSFLKDNEKPTEGLDIYVKEGITINNAVDVNVIKLPNGTKYHYINLDTQSKSRLGITYQRDYSKPNEYKISKDASGKNLLTMSFVSRMKIDLYNSLASATYTLGMKYFVSGSNTLENVNLADKNYVELVRDVTIPNEKLTRVDENINKSENGEYYAWGVDIPNIPLEKLDQKIYVVGYIKCNDLYYYSPSQCESVKTLATRYYNQGINNQECSYKEHLGMLNWLKNYTVGGK